MPDPLPPLDAPEHSDAWTFAYLDGELSADDRARFEEHLKSHDACREEVATMRAALPVFKRVLMEDGPPRPVSEYVEVLKAAEARVAARAPKKWAWPWAGLGFASLAGAAAALLFFVRTFAAVEPQLLKPVELAPSPGEEVSPPPPTLLELSTSVAFGRLTIEAPRQADDVHTAVGLFDSKHHRWLVQSGAQVDPTCAGSCGPLKLRVRLDALAPGPFEVGVLLSDRPVGDDRLGLWLPHATEEVPTWIGARAYGVAKVDR